jgi:hypothetical protein
MPVKFKVKSDLAKLHCFLRKQFGYLPSPKELSFVIGGIPDDWGRILRGHQEIKGEYFARLRQVKNSGLENASLELSAAVRDKKYGERTRKGRIVPHTKFVREDMYNYNLEKMTQEIMEKRSRGFEDEYDQYSCYLEIGQELEMYGRQYPKDSFEEQTLRREFINSLS